MQKGTYRIEVWCNGKRFPKEQYTGFSKSEKDGHYWKDTNYKEAKKIASWLSKHGYKVIFYEKKYARSGDYRQKFINANPSKNGKYRCVYCGHWIETQKMHVDHIVPVQGAKMTKKGKRLLRHMNGVNDLRNLVPSCKDCNENKGTSMSSSWRWKAKIGRHNWYWVLRRMFFLLLLLVAITSIILLVLHYWKILTV